MADDNNSDDSKPARGSRETARRIWLAGIGAYGRAYSEAQEAIKDMRGGTSKVFDELVDKGEMLEAVVESKSKELMEKAGVKDMKMPSFDMPDLHMEERIAKMRSRLMRGEEVAEDMSEMSARLDSIEAKLDKVLSMMETQAKPTRKAPAKKRTTTTRKPAAKKTTK